MKQVRLQRILLFIFITFSVSFSMFTVIRILNNFHLQDFSVYYQGIQDYLNNKNPYVDSRVIYPPIFLVLLSPVGFLTYELAEKVWILVSYMSIIGSIYILIKIIKRKALLVSFLTVYSLFMLSFPVKFTLGMGQINLILLLLISLSFYFFQGKQQYLSGAFLALAATIKLSPVVLLLFYVRKKQWKVVVSCITLFVLLNLLGVKLLGMQVTKDYWMNIFPSIPTVGNASYYNQALTGWLSRAFVPDLIAKTINFLVFGCLLIVSFFITQTTRKKPEIELSEFSLFIIATLIGAGLAWQHHLVVTLIPFTALWFTICQKGMKRSWPWTLAIMLSYCLIALNVKNPLILSGESLSFLLSHALYGVLLLYCLLIFFLRVKTPKIVG